MPESMFSRDFSAAVEKHQYLADSPRLVYGLLKAEKYMRPFISVNGNRLPVFSPDSNFASH